MLVQTSFDSHRDSSKAQLGPHITVINHDVDKGSLLGPPLGASRGSSGGSSMVMGIPSPRQLSRQGSSVESTAIVPLHHASVQQATTFSKVQKLNALFFELTLIWGHAYLRARLFEGTLIWAHASLSKRLFERTLIWANAYMSEVLLERTLIWEHAYCIIYIENEPPISFFSREALQPQRNVTSTAPTSAQLLLQLRTNLRRQQEQQLAVKEAHPPPPLPYSLQWRPLPPQHRPRLRHNSNKRPENVHFPKVLTFDSHMSKWTELLKTMVNRQRKNIYQKNI